MFFVLCWPCEFQQERRTRETHGRGRSRRGSEASTRRTARIARPAARPFAAGGSEADRESAAGSESPDWATGTGPTDRRARWRVPPGIGSGLVVQDEAAVHVIVAVRRFRRWIEKSNSNFQDALRRRAGREWLKKAQS